MPEILLPLGLAFIMFSLGLGLKISAFKRTLSHPLALCLGLMAQIVLLPGTAYMIAIAFSLSPEMALGLMILAACPGGVTAGIMTKLAHGDTALSITLTAITSLFSFVSVPLIVGSSAWYFLESIREVSIPTGQLVGGLLAITLFPVGAGLFLHGKIKYKIRSSIQKIASIVFVSIVLYTFISEWDVIFSNILILGPACLALNATTMLTGALLAKVSRLPARTAVALSMECGIQNSALGITMAIAILAQTELAAPSVVYAFVMNITAIVVIWMRKLNTST